MKDINQNEESINQIFKLKLVNIKNNILKDLRLEINNIIISALQQCKSNPNTPTNACNATHWTEVECLKKIVSLKINESSQGLR